MRCRKKMASFSPASHQHNHEKQQEAWTRVVLKRKVEYRRMDEKDQEKLLDTPILNGLELPSNLVLPQEKIDWVMDNLLKSARDSKINPPKRRSAYVGLKMLFRRIDNAEKVRPPSNSELPTAISIPVAVHHQENGISNIRNVRHGNTTKNNNSIIAEKSSSTLSNNTVPKPNDTSRSSGKSGTETTKATTLNDSGQHIQLGEARASEPSKEQQQSLTHPRPSGVRNGQKEPPQQPKGVHTNGSEKSTTTQQQHKSKMAAKPQSRASEKKRAPSTTDSADIKASPSMNSATPNVNQNKVSPVKTAADVSGQSPAVKRFRPGPILLPQIAMAMHPQSAQLRKQYITQMSKEYTSSLVDYPSGTYSWETVKLQDAEIQEAIKRFYKWEPYWEMSAVLGFTKTTSIVGVESNGNPKVINGLTIKPNSAAELDITIPVKFQKEVRDWGKQIPLPKAKYNPGDVRLLLLALPCTLPPAKPKGNPGYKKKARSDSHLWPKGTCVMTERAPRHIMQRKQQGHDVNEWLYPTSMLDLTQHISKANDMIPITILTFDTEPYYLCAAVCKYRSPEYLSRFLWESQLIEKLSISESTVIAKSYARKNQVCVLDDAEDDNAAGEASSFIFKLTCSINLGVIKTPVRARQCHHFQCFDLDNFLAFNVGVGGTRWECPICSNEFVSVYDLQYCELTKQLLSKYKDSLSSDRDRVQYYSDGRYILMPEKGKRYASSNVNPGGSKKRMPPDDADIIVL